MKTDYTYKVGQNIKKLRQNKGLSRKDLADQLGAAESTIGNWELGERFPRSDMIEKLSTVLGMAKENILGNPENFYQNGNNIIINLSAIEDKNTTVVYKQTILTPQQKKQMGIFLKSILEIEN